jgi:hypothetical protein
VDLVKTDVSKELISFMIRVKRSSKRLFLQEPHGITCHRIIFLIVTALKTSNIA